MTERTPITDNSDEMDLTPKPTFVSFLLDETGSMQPIKDDTVGGLNEYISTLAESGGDVLFSLVSFNSSRTQKRYVAEPIANVAPLSHSDYRPNASTPLIDASVKIIKATEDAVARRDDEPNVVIVLQTDGHENVSVEYDRRDLAMLVKEKEAAGWEFVFLGAGMDAFEAAHAAGMALSSERVLSYSRSQTPEMFAGAARSVAAFSILGESAHLDISPELREAAGDEYHDRREGKKKPRRFLKRREKRQQRDDSTTSTVDDFEL